jgi:membrane-bound metal-dependent hydrolase YbcI (DUF457 family)
MQRFMVAGVILLVGIPRMVLVVEIGWQEHMIAFPGCRGSTNLGIYLWVVAVIVVDIPG